MAIATLTYRGYTYAMLSKTLNHPAQPSLANFVCLEVLLHGIPHPQPVVIGNQVVTLLAHSFAAITPYLESVTHKAVGTVAA